MKVLDFPSPYIWNSQFMLHDIIFWTYHPSCVSIVIMIDLVELMQS
jgi:hypothetical protein